MTARPTAARLYPWLLGLGPLAVAALVSVSTPACSSKTSGSLGGDDESDASGSSSGGSSSGSGNGSSSSGGQSGGLGSSSGSSGASGSGGSSQRVLGPVQFNSAGVPLCGSTACDLSTHICCLTQALQATCIANTAMCPSMAASFGCLQKSDCPTGKVCCAVADVSTSTAGTACQDVASQGDKCLPATSANSASAQACQTSAECVNGATCSWQDCAVSGIPMEPELVLCGVQSEAPFNCSNHTQ